MKTITDGTAKFVVRDKRMQALVDMFYPVGTVYATTSGTKPEFMNYGTWEQFAQGRTLVGAGTGTDSNNLAMTFNAGATGGEYKHQLSVGEMPAHNHGDYSVYVGPGTWTGWLAGTGDKHISYIKLPTNGNDQPHNNIQPYTTVYYFKRVS